MRTTRSAKRTSASGSVGRSDVTKLRAAACATGSARRMLPLASNTMAIEIGETASSNDSTCCTTPSSTTMRSRAESELAAVAL